MDTHIYVRIIYIHAHMYGHCKINMPMGGITKQGNIYNVYYVYFKLQKHTYVVSHLLSERVLFTH